MVWTAGRATGLSGDQLQALLHGTVPDGFDKAERDGLGAGQALLASRDLNDDHYAAALDTLSRDRLAALVWLTGYYAMLARALAVFRPA